MLRFLYIGHSALVILAMQLCLRPGCALQERHQRSHLSCNAPCLIRLIVEAMDYVDHAIRHGSICRCYYTTTIRYNPSSSRQTYGLVRLCPSKSLPPFITLIHKDPSNFTNLHPKSYFPIINCFMMIVCLCHCVCS